MYSVVYAENARKFRTLPKWICSVLSNVHEQINMVICIQVKKSLPVISHEVWCSLYIFKSWKISGMCQTSLASTMMCSTRFLALSMEVSNTSDFICPLKKFWKHSKQSRESINQTSKLTYYYALLSHSESIFDPAFL